VVVGRKHCTLLTPHADDVGVEEALGLMCKGERSLFIIPASAMQPQADLGDGTSQQQKEGVTCLLPPPPAKAVQLEVELELLSVVQVGTQS
jgi:hypothetical protein